MLYVYAVAEDLGEIADLTGLNGETLQLISFAGGVAIAGEVAARPAVSPEALHTQDALVRALHDRAGALLPMRFGTASTDREHAIKALEAQGDLAARLAAVRGCEQMVLRVLGKADEPDSTTVTAAATSGTEYLLALAKRRQPAAALEPFAGAVGAISKRVKVEPAHQPGFLGAVYHLIERGHADEFRRTVAAVAAEHPAVRVLVSGPSPAYAFA